MGMPQLDIATYSSQIFWLIICFSCLLWFSAKHFIPQLKLIFKERWELTQGTLDKASVLEQEAKRVVDEREYEMETAKKKAHDHILLTLRQISNQLNQHRTQLSHSSKGRLKEIESRILTQKTLAKAQLPTIAFALSEDLAGHFLSFPASQQIIEDSVNRAMAQDGYL